MLSVALLFFVGRLETAQGAPIQNLTALHKDVAPGWVADPRGRGTWSLLYSCAFTLVLCVWTSIHLNVPPQDDTKLKYWRRKIKWVICALFAPEIVVFAAFQQWFAAWIFLRELNSLASSDQVDENKEGEQSSKRSSRYSMNYAYYAVMGGVMVDISHLHNTLSRATITTNGILFLAKHGYFLTITEESIQDKSKADLLAKGLVCVQVLWVVGQAIERKATEYPVTLLEVHTIVHIVCALILYALWIRKPQDVHEPTIISSEDFPGALAFMVLNSHFKSHPEIYIHSGESVCEQNGDVIFEKEKENQCELYLESFWYWFGNINRSAMPDHSVTEHGPAAHKWSWRVKLPADQQQSGQIVTYRKTTRQVREGITRDYTAYNILDMYALIGDPPPETVLTIYTGQALASGFGPRIRTGQHSHGDIKGHLSATYCGAEVMLSQKQLATLNMAGAFLKTKLDIDIGVDRAISLGDLNWKIRGYQGRMLCFREGNLRDTLFDYLEESGRNYVAPLLATAMVLIPTAYGGVHLGALSIMFPTPIERLLWKIACYILICVAAGVGGTLLLLSADMLVYTFYDSFLVASFARVVRWPTAAINRWRSIIRAPVLGILIAVPYVAVRLYIVVEAFISLRHVPIGVYQTPDSNFMDYIPHL